MTKKSFWSLCLLGIAAFAMGLGACSASDDDDGNDGGILTPPLETTATCAGCHTSEAMLKATVEDEGPAPESEGEG